jgi:serine/threonine-protein kinase
VDRIDRYELIRRLQQGGSGEVWLARVRGPGGFVRPVAVKIVAADREPHLANMVLDEARILGAISHPNIVQVFDVGQAGNRYYLAMEYIAGTDLYEMLNATAKGVLDLEPVLFIATRVARALHAAHCYREGGKPHPVLHRDVSPGNVVVCKHGTVKLIDFGIARSPNRLNRTLPGPFKGTAQFMAPEQFTDRPLDGRADVYGLGAVLATCVLGTRVFGSDGCVDSRRVLVLAGKAGLSRPFVALLGSALEHDRNARPATAEQFGKSCHEILQRLHPGYDESDLSAYVTLFREPTDERIRAPGEDLELEEYPTISAGATMEALEPVTRTPAPRRATGTARPEEQGVPPLRVEIEQEGRRRTEAIAEGLCGRGVFLRTGRTYEVGDSLWLVIFSGPTSLEPLAVRGRVAWLKPDGAGIGFDPHNQVDCGRIMDWLASFSAELEANAARRVVSRGPREPAVTRRRTARPASAPRRRE